MAKKKKKVAKRKAPARAKKAKDPRDELLAELLGGARGIKKWNARTAAQLRAAQGFQNANLAKSHLDGAKFRNLNFQGSNLDRSSLVGANCGEDANFRNASFVKADLSGAKMLGDFSMANFEGANLAGAKIERFFKGNLKKANLTDADLRDANLCGVDLTGANLDGTKLRGASYNEQTRFDNDYTPPKGMFWDAPGKPPHKRLACGTWGPIDAESLIQQVQRSLGKPRVARALDMLKAERFELFSQKDRNHVIGVVKSQTNPDLVYSCQLKSDGTYCCCTQNLNVCGGLNGAVCKHLLVLVIGLVQAGKLEAAKIDDWLLATRRKDPDLDKDLMADNLFRYNGAMADEADWRPTETVPEDYYTF